VVYFCLFAFFFSRGLMFEKPRGEWFYKRPYHDAATITEIKTIAAAQQQQNGVSRKFPLADLIRILQLNRRKIRKCAEDESEARRLHR
jgi:hypothetical protein